MPALFAPFPDTFRLVWLPGVDHHSQLTSTMCRMAWAPHMVFFLAKLNSFSASLGSLAYLRHEGRSNHLASLSCCRGTRKILRNILVSEPGLGQGPFVSCWTWRSPPR